MRWLLILIVCVGCAGGKARVKTPPKPDLPDGDGIYTLRYNPPACCDPLLHFEIQTPSGWERVALEGANDADQVEILLTDFRQRPNELRRIEGDLSFRLVEWNGRHRARVLVVRQLDPEDP